MPSSFPYLSQPHPALFAHRGGAKLWPENTLVAFEGALDLGCGFLETDIHRTKDGILVVHHDDTVDRTTDGTGPIADMTIDEVKGLDAGYRFSPDGLSFPFRHQGVAIPTLEELLELCERKMDPVRLNVEIKARDDETVRAFHRLITGRELEDAFLVAAGHDPTIAAFRKLSQGRIATGAGMREALRFWAASKAGVAHRLSFAFDALQVPPTFGPLTVVTPKFIEDAHGLGIAVHMWTIDRPDDMRRFLAMGADGIMTDRPDYLMQIAGAPN